MLVVFSRLDLAVQDRERIERFRREHDPQHGFVEAHFTHVFPFSGLAAEEVAAHVSAVAAQTEAIAFRLCAAVAVPDAIDPVSRVFLIPGVGGEPLEALHRRLYSGVLAAHLRPDLPYRPHVTVAAFADHADAQRVAGAFGPVDIPGRIPSVELAEINSGKLRGLESFPLGSS